jgi:hypothetical protein
MKDKEMNAQEMCVDLYWKYHVIENPKDEED